MEARGQRVYDIEATLNDATPRAWLVSVKLRARLRIPLPHFALIRILLRAKTTGSMETSVCGAHQQQQ